MLFGLTLISGRLHTQNCSSNASGLIPIHDLGRKEFNGYTGGKYPGGSNKIPYAHFIAGKHAAEAVTPLDQNGRRSEKGRIGFVILGYSTAAMTGRSFISVCNSQPVNPQLEFVIGAQGGRDINSMTNRESTYWDSVSYALQEKDLTALQVQIVWISTGDIVEWQLPFPDQSLQQVEKYRQMLGNLRYYYPNLQLVFISDRPYAGYIGGENGGPKELAEPTAYYNSWAVKWVIEKQLGKETGYTTDEIPFIDWGPMLWTDGEKGNNSHYQWLCDDAGKGGIHASSKGRMKEAALLFHFFTRHPYTKNIFINR